LKYIYDFSESESFLEERSSNKFFIKRYNDLKSDKNILKKNIDLINSESFN
jgi:hypothetical protein